MLRIWRFGAGRLTEVAAAPGLTNHRIGDRAISGGIRNCGGRPELILADPDWRRLRAIRLDGATLVARDVGPILGPGAFARALACR